MTVSYGTNVTLIYCKWPELRDYAAACGQPIRYEDNPDHYEIYMFDQQVAKACFLYKGSIPLSDFTQEENDTWRAEFEAGYKTSANRPQTGPLTVIPTAPKNEYSLLPYGMVHAHLNSSSNVVDITLSAKVGDTYDFSCSRTPSFYDCLTNGDSSIRDGVMSVNGGKLTTFYGRLEEGTYHLCQPFVLDFDFPTYYQVYSMWGCYVSAKDFGEDDLVRLQIVDKVGVGVQLGLYSQEEFDAMGGECVIKEYDECWIHQLDKVGRAMTPDGAPAIIYAGLTARALYYPKDITKTDIKVWLDYIVSIKDG